MTRQNAVRTLIHHYYAGGRLRIQHSPNERIGRLSWVIVILAICQPAVFPISAQQTASIVVDVGTRIGPVNRLVLGQNIIAVDNSHIFSSDNTDLNLIQRGDGFWDPSRGSPVLSVVEESRATGMSLLRYPGGCLAHNFDWRKAVGPEARRSGWLFGLDQYLSLCASIGATPLITISDYALPADQMPENAAELVEYLNSPADAAHPWALKRKQWGHPAPYGVVWFELGNESIHGNHRVLPHRQFTAEQYAAYARATAAAMRRVDPRIKVGILMVPGPGTDVDCNWNHTVVKEAGSVADFVVIHMYAPQAPGQGLSGNLLIQAMLATPQHVAARLRTYHQMIRQQLGHDLPLAVTEFNGAVYQDAAPYRLSYANALECADLLRVFLQPESNVILASYWQFLNGPFGMLRTTEPSQDGQPAKKEPAALLYELWSQHIGAQLLKVETRSPRTDFPGSGSEEASFGDTAEPRRLLQRYPLQQYNSVAGTLWPKLLDVQIQRQGDDLNIRVNDLSKSIFPTLAQFPRPSGNAGSAVEFSVSLDAKFTPDPGTSTAPMGIALMDSRGWNQTHSGMAIDTIGSDWQHIDGSYRLEAETPSVNLTARLLADRKKVTGTLQIRNLSVSSYAAGHDAAYPLLTSVASVSPDIKKVFLVVINKSATTSIPTDIRLMGFPVAKARYWEVNGPDLASDNGVTQTKNGTDLQMKNGSTGVHDFPAHSMTAIEFSGAS